MFKPALTLLYSDLPQSSVVSQAAFETALEAADAGPVGFLCLDRGHDWLRRQLLLLKPSKRVVDNLVIRYEAPPMQRDGAAHLRRLIWRKELSLLVVDHLARLWTLNAARDWYRAERRALEQIGEVVRDQETRAVVVHRVPELDARELKQQGLVDKIRRAAPGVSAFERLTPADYLVVQPVDGALVRIADGSCECTSADAGVCWRERYLGFGGPKGRSAIAEDGPCGCACHSKPRTKRKRGRRSPSAHARMADLMG